MANIKNIFFIALFFVCASTATAQPVDIQVTGIGGEPLENVKKTLVLPYGLVHDGVVNEPSLERYTSAIPERVRRALEPYGYYQAVIDSKLEKLGKNSYRIAVAVQPGTPIRLIDVNLTLSGPGSSEKRLKQLIDSFPLKKGDILLQNAYEKLKGDLESRAIELGYLDAGFPLHKIEIDPEKSLARIDLNMDTGRQYRFDRVRFEGATRYPEDFLRRYVTIKPGDLFSYAKLGETQLNLVNSERFKEVIPVLEKEKAVDYHIPVLMRLREAPTKRVRPGIGYATDIGPRFSLEYRDLNVSDEGHEFRSELNLSDVQQNIGAAYTLPSSRDTNSFTGLQVNLKRESVNTYTSKAATTELSRTRSFKGGRLGTVYVKVEREDSDLESQNVHSRLVIPGVRFSERRYDNLVRPKQGHYMTVDLRGTDEGLGSNSGFVQIVTEGNILVPLASRLSLYSRLKAGATFRNEPVNSLPASYRFFAGGDRSVRGYDYQSLGPIDATGSVVGGTDILVGSIELDQALSPNWSVAAFYDAGNAFNSFTDVHLMEGAGMGLRYYTVVGALRLDVARQLDVERPKYRIHFTVGFVF